MEYMNKITPLLEKLAEKLGTNLDLLWETVVRQQIFEGYWEIGISGLFLFLFIGACFLFRYGFKEEDDDICTAGVVIGTLTLIIMLFVAYQGTGRLYNPEYFALKEIMRWIN